MIFTKWVIGVCLTRWSRLLVISCFCFSPIKLHAQQLKLDVSLDKPLYEIGEDIWLNIGLVNQGVDPIVVPWPSLYERRITCRLLDSKMVMYPYVGLAAESVDTGRSLVSGARLARLTPLLEAFGSRVWRQSLLRQLPPEDYSLSCSCRWKEFDISATSPIAFTIANPSPGVLSRWKELISADSRSNARKGANEKTSKFNAFLTENPNSPWSPRLLSALDALDPPNSVNYAKRLLNEFPESPWCDFALITLSMRLSRSELQSELDQIKQRHSSTRLGSVVDATLKNRKVVDTHAEVVEVLGRALNSVAGEGK